MFKRLTVTILAFCVFASDLSVNAKLNVDSAMKKQAKELYIKINDFISEYGNVAPEKFDDICKTYMTKDSTSINLLDKKEFEEKSLGNIVLYRGLNEKSFSDSLKKGMIFWPSNTKNVRGMGIYTTTSLMCAKRYSNKSSLDTVVKMFLPKTDLKC